MLIEFQYKLPDGLIPLVNKSIVDFNNDTMIGWLDAADGSRLKHCALYMICESEEHSGMPVYRNPLAIVAKNTSAAMEAFYNITQKENGTILCEIASNCSKILVVPTGRTM